MKKKIAIIVGTRPEIIRFSPIIQYLEKNKDVSYSLIHTGQHYSKEMSDIFFEELSLPNPTINLAICTTSPYQQLAEIIEKTGQYIMDDKPDVVCVWGDTNSSLGAAIAANKTHTMLCHIEAGCRSGDFRMAEEYNRILIDNMSDLLFPVAQCDSLNLTKEKIHGRITFLGDPLYDAFLYNRKRVLSNKIKNISELADFSILLTLHRAENVDNPEILKRILKAINKTKSGKILFPIHPRTRKMIEGFGLTNLVDNEIITTTEPLGYFEMLKMLKICDQVITDSGGLQKEAFFAEKACITLRKSTEQIDTIRLGVNTLIDPEGEGLDTLPLICSNYEKTNSLFMQISEKPYGDGSASKKIVDKIINEIS
jgi:UDP-N-acetylglucosamine 2-epimerase